MRIDTGRFLLFGARGRYGFASGEGAALCDGARPLTIPPWAACMSENGE